MTWDASRKVYVRWGCNSRGTIGTDTLTYDEKGKTWHGSTQQKDYYGTAQTDRFTETFVDANTIDQKGSNWKATLRRRR